MRLLQFHELFFVSWKMSYFSCPPQLFRWRESIPIVPEGLGISLSKCGREDFRCSLGHCYFPRYSLTRSFPTLVFTPTSLFKCIKIEVTVYFLLRKMKETNLSLAHQIKVEKTELSLAKGVTGCSKQLFSANELNMEGFIIWDETKLHFLYKHSFGTLNMCLKMWQGLGSDGTTTNRCGHRKIFLWPEARQWVRKCFPAYSPNMSDA